MSEQVPPPPRTGVIHDIGYRHYDGPRLGRLAITQALLAASVRHAYGIGRSGKSKVMPILLLAVMVVPVAIIVGVEISLQLDSPPVIPAHYVFYLQPVIALYLASQAPQLFSRDLRYGSIVLYLARPPRRTDYALAKFGALVIALMILISIPLTVLYAGALLAKFDFVDMTREFGTGLAGGLMLSVLLAAIGGLIAAATPRRGFAVAAIITVLIVSFTATITTTAILDTDQDMKSTAARFANLGSPFTLSRTLSTFLFRDDSDGWIPTTTQGLVFLAVYLVVVGLCLWGLNRRYAKVARG
ncbi:ABC transporter permease subunit [Kribbella sp. NPDC051770]|uniref:ABC transporter permease subunit n=1 Tax=Kribbella sp. NPDC051770 TaxID=3155413 RepID=UPI00342C47A7